MAEVKTSAVCADKPPIMKHDYHASKGAGHPSSKIGDVGYTFRKYFPGHGMFQGRVVKIRIGAAMKKDRRCMYSDGDIEDLSLEEIQRLEPAAGSNNFSVGSIDKPNVVRVLRRVKKNRKMRSVMSHPNVVSPRCVGPIQKKKLCPSRSTKKNRVTEAAFAKKAYKKKRSKTHPYSSLRCLPEPKQNIDEGFVACGEEMMANRNNSNQLDCRFSEAMMSFQLKRVPFELSIHLLAAEKEPIQQYQRKSTPSVDLVHIAAAYLLTQLKSAQVKI